MNAKKIWILSYGFPSDKYPSNGIFQYDQAKALCNAGLDVTFIAIDVRSIRKKRHWGIAYYTIDGILVYEYNLPIGPVKAQIRDTICEVAFNRLAKKIVKKDGRPDLVHGHFAETTVCAVKFCKKNQIPLIITEHASTFSAVTIPSYIRKIALETYEYASKVISVSGALQYTLRRVLNIDSIVIPNIADFSVFELCPKNSRDDTCTEFVCTANLIEGKRQHLIIRAIKRLLEAGLNVRLTLFGDGVNRKNLETLTADLGIRERVCFRGLQTREVIAREYVYMDVFVLPSISETFGVAYIEAMASGLPVIATRCGGPESFVNESNGILVDIDDEDGLVYAMKSMIDRIGDFDREQIRKQIVDTFSPEIIAGKIIDVYQQM